MNFLDMRTIVVGQAIGGVICTLVVGLLWLHNRRRYAGLSLWFAGYALQLAGVLLLLTRGLLPNLISMVVANMLNMGGMVFLYAGFARFTGRPGFDRLNWILLAVFSCIFYYFSIIVPDLPARNAVLNIFLAYFAVRSVLLLRGGPAELRPFFRSATYTLTGFVLVCAVRLGFLLFGHPAYEFYSTSGPDAFLLLIYPAIVVMLTFSLFLMVNRRLLADTQADYKGRLQAEAALNGALKLARLGTWSWDIKNNCVSWSGEMYNIFGIDPKTFSCDLARIMTRAIHPEDRARVEAANLAVMKDGKPEGTEYRVIWPDGSVHWIYAEAFELIKDEGGAPSVLKGYAQDITTRKNSEEKLVSSEKSFRDLFENMSEGFALHKIILDAEGRAVDYRFLSVNKAFEVLTGLKAADIIGKTVLQALPGLDEEFIRVYSQVALTGEPVTFERRSEPLGKDYRVVAYRPSPEQFATIFSDITEWKKTEAALKASEEHSRLIVENAPEAIFVQSEGKFVYLNPACCALLGVQRQEELLGRDFMDRMAPKYRDIIRERIKHQVKTGNAAPPLEEEYLRCDGTSVDVETIAIKVRFQGRDSHLVFVRDITVRKRAEAAMQTAQKLESLGALAGGIAHDFNNLLTGITGNLSLIRNAGGVSGEVPELVSEAESACRTAKGLARQLLTFASGGEPVKSVLDLSELVRESVAFSLRGAAVGRRVTADLGKVFVQADKDQLFQVIQNLAMNSMQAMADAGSITASVSKVELKEGEVSLLAAGPYARVEVSDTGPGIPQEALHRIFEPYYSTKGKGRGLGLAVCRSIILKHGGQIIAASGTGGAVFEIYLPLAETPAAITDRSLKSEPKKGGGRVLIMDDEEVVYKALRRMLSALGYEAEVTVTGEKALEAWQAARAAGKPFAAVIMDLTISGGMGGAEAIKRLLELDPAAKAIVSSGYADDPVMAEHKAYGFSGTLSKPYRLEDLARVLAEVIG